MSGQIKKMIDLIIERRTRGNKGLVYTTKAKLLIKGIDPDAYDDNSADDPVILEQLKVLALELGVLNSDKTPEHITSSATKNAEAVQRNTAEAVQRNTAEAAISSTKQKAQEKLERRKKMVEKSFSREKTVIETKSEISSPEPPNAEKVGIIKKIFRLFQSN